MDGAVAALWECCHEHGISGVELEFRLGHALPGHYSTNVGRENFAKLKRVMDASRHDAAMKVETVEKIGGTAKHVTTLALDDKPPPPPYCMTKTKTFSETYPTSTPYAVRCSIALERFVTMTFDPKLTRHKKRTRYVFGEWAIDLTEVVSNSDVDSEESFEVEVELLDPTVLFKKPMDVVIKHGAGIVEDILKFLSA